MIACCLMVGCSLWTDVSWRSIARSKSRLEVGRKGPRDVARADWAMPVSQSMRAWDFVSFCGYEEGREEKLHTAVDVEGKCFDLLPGY